MPERVQMSRGPQQSLQRLASRLLDEQRARWECGEPAPAEEYLLHYPELQADPEAVVDLIYQEVLLQNEKGRVLRLSDCIRRFPQYEAQLKAQFDLHAVLESPSLREHSCVVAPAQGPGLQTLPQCGASRGRTATGSPDSRAGVGSSDPTLAPARVGAGSPDPAPAPVLPLIPGYEIQGELGGGGMGVVYLAYDPRLKRQVAIKVIRNGSLARKEELTRFRTEAEAIARLQHPNLAQIHEVGEHRDGPYLVLEYLEGGSLDQKLAGKPQPARAAACLVETLARAIHQAHERGIVHRDLKPGNVLLCRKSEIRNPKSENDCPCSDFGFRISDFSPKVSDFGLAKLLNGGAGVTSSGAVLGTASYMPPEQVIGDTNRIGPAADVYALGAILYELLTGQPPFQVTSAAETMLQVLHEDPVPPRRLQSRVPRDLDTICLKCLQKKPGRRYASAQSLAVDLARFLAGEPITARSITACERAMKWARRRPAVAALSALIIAITVLAFGMVTWKWQDEERARKRAEYLQQVAEKAKKRANAARTKEAEERQRYQGLSLNLAVDRGRQFCEEGDVGRGLLHLARSLEWARDEQEDWQHVIRTNLDPWTQSLCSLQDCLPHKGRVLAAAWSPDGHFALTGCSDRKALVWDVTTGEPVGEPLVHPARVNAVAYSTDGSKIATAIGDPGSSTGAVWLWDAGSRRPLNPPLTHPGPVWAVAFSPDGRRILTGSSDSTNGQGAIQLWDTSTGTPLGAPWSHPKPVRAAAFSPDGQTILSGCEDRSARLWVAVTGERRHEFKHKGYVQAVAFSPDGKTIATGSRDSTARLWDPATGRPIGEPLRDTGYVEAVAFSPDGKTLVTGSRDGMARLWDVSTGKLIANVLPHQDQVTAVAFHPHGRMILTGSFDRSARLWEMAPPKAAVTTFAHPTQLWAAAVSPDARTVAKGSSNGTAKLWSVGTGQLIGQPLPSNGPIQSLAFRPDGAVVVVGGDHKAARLWEVATGKPLGDPLEHPAAVMAVAFRPDGQTVVTGCRDGKARLWDMAKRSLIGSGLPHLSPVGAVAFHPKNSNLVLTGCDDRSARLWDVAQGPVPGDFWSASKPGSVRGVQSGWSLDRHRE